MRSRYLALVLGAAALLPALPAHAALDEVLAGSDVQVVRLADHDLKQRQRGDVKELADASGKVAAVTWRGFQDLHELLGTHLSEYEAALKTQRGLHFVHARTATMEISIVSYGRMRSSTVTLTKRLPEGVKIDAIR